VVVPTAEYVRFATHYGFRPDELSCVRFGSARYSVPSRLIGASVLVEVHCGTIRILEPFTGEIAAEHQLVTPGEVSIIDEVVARLVVLPLCAAVSWAGWRHVLGQNDHSAPRPSTSACARKPTAVRPASGCQSCA
jgi:hypothetical protein